MSPSRSTRTREAPGAFAGVLTTPRTAQQIGLPPPDRDTPARARSPRPTAHLAIVGLLALLAPGSAGAEAAVQAPLAIESLLLDGAVVGSRLVVVGARGHVLVSTDDGVSWTQAEVPTRVLLTAVHMHDERTGWAVGHDAVILRTDDGGGTWSMVHQAPEEELPLLDVWFRDALTGFAVGAYGYFLATEDGGETWATRTISANDFHLNALVPVGGPASDSSRPPSQRLFIAGEAGVAYRSDDGGANWHELSLPYAGSWFGGLALDEDQVVLAGLRGHLFRSADGGETWAEVTTRTRATLTGAVQLPSGRIIVTGLEGSVLTSDDGGRSVAGSRLASRAGISAALPLSDGGVLLVGEFGVRRWPGAD